MDDISSRALEAHYKWKGKLSVVSKVPVANKDDLSLAYTPGVAAPCLEIASDPAKSWDLTGRRNTVAVITDGTAVLGLGDIGPLAAMPVMEGKCVLFREFGGVDAVPICLSTKDPDEIVRTVSLISKSFGGINLEDISAPRCFEIESRLQDACDIPVFHDDQHGTAIVVLAALMNALKVVSKKPSDVRIVVNGAGAAGIAVVRLLGKAGIGDVAVCDTRGVIRKGREGMNPVKEETAEVTNRSGVKGTLSDAMRGADVFIGVSAPGAVSPEMIASMAPGAIVFPMANPVPEIGPDEAKASGAAVVGTGRSDYPNQINNVLAFPGVFRGALDSLAARVNDEMKIAAAHALADLAGDELSADFLLPLAFDPRVRTAVSGAVFEAAVHSGAARI